MREQEQPQRPGLIIHTLCSAALKGISDTIPTPFPPLTLANTIAQTIFTENQQNEQLSNRDTIGCILTGMEVGSWCAKALENLSLPVKINILATSQMLLCAGLGISGFLGLHGNNTRKAQAVTLGALHGLTDEVVTQVANGIGSTSGMEGKIFGILAMHGGILAMNTGENIRDAGDPETMQRWVERQIQEERRAQPQR